LRVGVIFDSHFNIWVGEGCTLCAIYRLIFNWRRLGFRLHGLMQLMPCRLMPGHQRL